MTFLGMPDTGWEILSYVGAVLMLLPFALQGVGRMDRRPAYFALNLVGGSLVSLYSAKLGSPALTILEGAWAVAAVFGWISWTSSKRPINAERAPGAP
jgi:hypothetical protein